MIKRLRFGLVLCLCISLGACPLLTLSTAGAAKPTAKSVDERVPSSTSNKAAKLVSRRTALHTTSNLRRRPSPRLPQRLIPTLLPGQTGTQLSNGQWALIGGEGKDGPSSDISVWDSKTNQTTFLIAQLRHARAWHTATMLPDGTILIFGGLGKTGQVLASAEIFNP